MPSSATIEELLRAYEQARAEGQPQTLAEVCKDCPDLLPELRQRLVAAIAGPRLAHRDELPETCLPDPQADARLGKCAWFVWDLRRANVIQTARLDDVVSTFLQQKPLSEPEELADHLVARGYLTKLQTERLLQGKTDGFVIGPYTLTAVLGAGSMGTVYRARSKNDDREYALKVLPRRSIWNVRLAKNWVKAFADFQHPAIVPFTDVGTAGGMHYLVWPFVAGTPLDQLVQRQGKLEIARTIQIVLRTSEGLLCLHRRRLVHGLLKPGNLSVGDNNEVSVLDCGIGCLLGQNPDDTMLDTMSTANAIVSGLDCASPERIADGRNLTPLSDQYSLGCVLYYCFTGRYPFAGKTAVEKMVAHQTRKPTTLRLYTPELPEALEAIVLRMLEKEPSERFADLAAANAALQPFAPPRASQEVAPKSAAACSLPPIIQRPGAIVPRRRARRRKSKRVAWLSITSVAALLVAGMMTAIAVPTDAGRALAAGFGLTAALFAILRWPRQPR